MFIVSSANKFAILSANFTLVKSADVLDELFVPIRMLFDGLLVDDGVVAMLVLSMRIRLVGCGDSEL